jgi:hypothetical protein
MWRRPDNQAAAVDFEERSNAASPAADRDGHRSSQARFSSNVSSPKDISASYPENVLCLTNFQKPRVVEVNWLSCSTSHIITAFDSIFTDT